jgi:hypothetical protein
MDLSGESNVVAIVDPPPPSEPHPDDIAAATPSLRIRPQAVVDSSDSEEETDGDAVALQIYTDFRNFRIISDSIDKAFSDKYYLSSAALDIIAMYLKGQKTIYIESKTYCEQFLNCLMLPAIFISALTTVLSPALGANSSGPIVVSSLTGVNSFILAIISFLKLDAKAEAHKSSAYQFDKLQSMVEFQSGKVLFFQDTKALEMINIVEKKVAEIKDTNQFVVPESVRNRFHNIYTTNVFTRVKMLENEESQIKNRLKTAVTKLRTLRLIPQSRRTNEEAQELRKLETEEQECFNEYCKLRGAYLEIDQDFNDEIKDNRKLCSRRFNPCNCLKT